MSSSLLGYGTPRKIRRRDIEHNDTQHNDTQHKGLIWDTQHTWHSAYRALSKMALNLECWYTECRDLFIIIMLSVVMLNVVAPNDVCNKLFCEYKPKFQTLNLKEL